MILSFLQDTKKKATNAVKGAGIKAVKSYFKPTEKVRTRDVIREIPKSIIPTAKKTGNFALGFLQGTARTGAQLGNIVAPNTISKDYLEDPNKSKAEKVVFGQAPGTSEGRKNYNRDWSKETLGLKGNVAEAAGYGMAAVGSLLDVSGGKGKATAEGKEILEAIAKTGKVKDIMKLGKKIGITDTDTLVKLVSANTTKKVSEIVDNAKSVIAPKLSEGQKAITSVGKVDVGKTPLDPFHKYSQSESVNAAAGIDRNNNWSGAFNEKTGKDYLNLQDYMKGNKGREGAIVYMSPQEYIDRVKAGGGKANISDYKYYVDKMKSGQKFEAPEIVYRDKGIDQEGLHRAAAARELGIEKIPVVVGTADEIPLGKHIDINKYEPVISPKLSEGQKAITSVDKTAAVDGEKVFIRFGEPGNKPSTIWDKGKAAGKEKGVSVYAAHYDKKTGKYVLDINPGDEGSATMENFIGTNRKAYIVDGKPLDDIGTDTEHLLDHKTVSVRGEINKADVTDYNKEFTYDGNEILQQATPASKEWIEQQYKDGRVTKEWRDEMVSKLSQPTIGKVDNIHPEDQTEMAKFIDYVRGTSKLDERQINRLQVSAGDIEKHYGLGTAKTDKELAGIFEKKLGEVGYRGKEPEFIEPKITADPMITPSSEVIEPVTEKLPEIYKKTWGEKLTPKFLGETSKNIGAQGVAGKEISQRIATVFDGAERKLGGAEADIGLAKMSKKEAQNLKDVAEGIAEPMNEKVAKAVQGWTKIRSEIADEASKVGLTIRNSKGEELPFKPREDFFPRQLRIDDLQKSSTREKALQHMVDTKQAKNIAQADRILQSYVSKVTEKRAGSLEHAREFELPEEFYEDDARKVLAKYLEDSYHRIESVKYLGKKDEIITDLIEKVRQEGGDYKYVQKAFDEITKGSKASYEAKKASKLITGVETVTKMSLAALTNVGQSINTATKTGMVNTLKAMAKSFTKEGKEFALRSGATTGQAIDGVLDTAAGTSEIASKFLKAVQFTRVEQFNRTVSSIAGKSFAEDMFKVVKDGGILKTRKGAREALESLGIDVVGALQRGSLSEDDLLKAGQAVTNKTQFKTRVQDIQLWASSPQGRVINQFHSFAFKQGQFIRDEILKEAIKGNLKPLVTFSLLTLTAGDAIATVKAKARGKERESWTEDPVARAFENFTTVGGFGLVTDTIKALDSGEQAILSLIGGPAVSDIAKVGESVGDTITGKMANSAETPQAKKLRKKSTGLSKVLTTPQRNAARTATRAIPVVGPYLTNKLLPPLNEKKTTTKSTGSTITTSKKFNFLD